MSSIKEELYSYCLRHIEEQSAAIQQKINDARDAASEDTKSSAGDKYETGRAMMQQETDRNMAQLTEANKLKVALNQINPAVNNDRAETGSIVITNLAKFYISISAGALAANGDTYMAISPASPIGLKMKGLQVGDEFNLNGKVYKLESIL